MFAGVRANSLLAGWLRRWHSNFDFKPLDLRVAAAGRCSRSFACRPCCSGNSTFALSATGCASELGGSTAAAAPSSPRFCWSLWSKTINDFLTYCEFLVVGQRLAHLGALASLLVLGGERLLLTGVERLRGRGRVRALQHGRGGEVLRVPLGNDLHLVLRTGRVTFHD